PRPPAISPLPRPVLRCPRSPGGDVFRQAAERALKLLGGGPGAPPTAAPQLLAASLFASAKPMEIVLAGPSADPEMFAMLKAIRERFLPNAIVMRGEYSPVAMPAIEGRPTAYVCENYACKLPVTRIEALEASIPALP